MGILLFFCYTLFIMFHKKQRWNFLDRAEDAVLEHIPPRYQKSVVGAYRLGFFVKIIGTICAIFTSFLIVCFFAIESAPPINALIACVVALLIFFGMMALGAYYTRLKISPSSALGWALILGSLSLILAGFFGFILIATFIAHLGRVYGSLMMATIRLVLAIITLLSLIIFINAASYIVFARKGHQKWYEDYSRRHHLGEASKKPHRADLSARESKDEEYVDDEL